MFSAATQRQGAALGGVAPSVGDLFVPAREGRAPARAARPSPKRAPALSLPSVADLASFPGLLLPKPQPVVVARPAAPAQPAPVAPAAPAAKPKLRLSWAGSGIYFWWQLGAVSYLMSRFRMDDVAMVGASGGGFAAMLAACGVDPEVVMESAYALSKQHNVWERPAGLLGVWGSIIEAWLHDMLPPDAAERCSGRVGIVVTQLPSCRQVVISDFKDKADLINVAMASAHVPLFLDWKMSRECRGVPCVDGSFPDFFTGVNCDLLTCGGDAVVFDYFEDSNIVRNGRMDMLSVKEFREFKKIIALGYRYAKRLDQDGAFERFDTEGLELGAPRPAPRKAAPAPECVRTAPQLLM